MLTFIKYVSVLDHILKSFSNFIAYYNGIQHQRKVLFHVLRIFRIDYYMILHFE
jgi:hypothetical protein